MMRPGRRDRAPVVRLGARSRRGVDLDQESVCAERQGGARQGCHELVATSRVGGPSASRASFARCNGGGKASGAYTNGLL